MSVKIFFCYAREDEPLLNKLKAQLKSLQRHGLIDVWHDRDIQAGTDWEHEISHHLNTAQIILLLVSSDFMDSDYCYSIEMKRAIERHKRGEAYVIPIVLRPVHWQEEPLDILQALPIDAKPVTSWSNLDEALFNVADGIRKVVKEQWFKISNTYYKTELHEKAMQAINQAIRLDSRDTQLYKMKGSILHRLGQLEEALAAFEQAKPHDIDTYVSKGLLLSELGRDEEALKICERAIELGSSSPTVYYAKGQVLQKLARYQEALAAFEQSIRIGPGSAEMYESKAQVLVLLKQYTEACLAYERAIKLNNNNPNLYSAQGSILRELGLHEGALVDFEQAIALDPNNPSLFKEKALTLQRLKRIEEAREAYKKVRQLSGGSSLVEMVVEDIIRGEGETKQGEIILREAKQNRYLIIPVAGIEALGAANQPQETKDKQLSRLYNLLKDIILGLDASIAMVTIYELLKGTFYANMTIKIIDKEIEFDIHIEDALSMAIYAKAPIFVEEDVLERTVSNIGQSEENSRKVERSTRTDIFSSGISQVSPLIAREASEILVEYRVVGGFTEQARNVLSLADEEARRFQHNYIGTEHLLLGLVSEGEGVAAKVLRNLGVELDKVRNRVAVIIDLGDRVVLGEINLTPRAKKVIELAVEEARRLNHDYMGTEHLLLGLMRESEGIAAEVLRSFVGMNLGKIRAETIRVLSEW